MGISGPHITTSISKGVVAVSRADGEITVSDVGRVIEAARTVALPPNREILHVIPRSYVVDGQEKIDDPVGMTGIRLEVEALVVSGATSAIKNLTKCIFQAGLEIDDLVFAPLATGYTFLTKKQKEIGVGLLDIGGGTTSLVVFEEGDILHAAVLPIGSGLITNDLAIGLRTSIETAEKIKINYASAIPDKIRESETVSLAQFDAGETEKIEKKYISEIVQARLGEIYSLVANELKTIGKDGMLPAGVVLTGGGSKLEDLIEATKDYLRLPAEIGKQNFELGGFVDKLGDPVYATSVALMLYSFEHSQSSFSPSEPGILGKAKGFLKHLLP
ncbi:MAG: cell division protein FtsA [Candidatus Berkelbacteria bacterium]|nr:cell division protein FtsA [Candidatus Berkelbacteria bacterium]